MSLVVKSWVFSVHGMLKLKLKKLEVEEVEELEEQHTFGISGS